MHLYLDDYTTQWGKISFYNTRLSVHSQFFHENATLLWFVGYWRDWIELVFIDHRALVKSVKFSWLKLYIKKDPGYLHFGCFVFPAESGATKLPALPEKVTYLIIGGGTAAFAAYRAIRSRDPKGKVSISLSLFLSMEVYQKFFSYTCIHNHDNN